MRSIQFFLAVLIVGTMLSAVLAAQRTEMSGTPTSSPPRALVDTFDVTHAYTRCYGGSYTERNPLVRSDRAGNVLLCGGTGSKDFPQIPWEKEYNEYDASVFVMKLRPEDGSIIYSRRFGSTSTLLDVEIGKDDRVIVLLENPYLDPILTPDAQWSTRTPIGMVVLDSAGTMIYCSYLRTDLLYDVVGMECSARGDLFILATTHATPPMATPDALFPSHQGGMDGFLMKFSSEDYRLVYASCFGGPGDDAYYSLATDGCSVVLIGTTMSNGYPLMHPLQDRIYGGRDFILSRISADGQEIIWSTYLGSSGQETGISEVRFLRSICFDDAGNLTFIGQTDSRDFPVTDVISSFGEGRQDIVLCRISPEGRLDFSTHLGTSTYDYAAEIAVDACGHVIVTGESDGSTFPLVHPLMTEGSSFLLVIDTEQPSLLFSTRMGRTRDQRRGCVTMLHDTTLFAVASADSGAMLPVTIGGPAHSNGTDIYLSAFTMPELCSLSPFTEFADRYPEVSAEIITQDTLLIELRRQVSWPVEFPISIRLRNHSPDVSSDPISVGLTLPTGLELALGSLPPQMSLPGLQPLEQRIVTWTVRAYQKAITPDTVVSFVLSYHVSGDCPRSDVIETGIPVKYTDLFYADLRCTLDVPAPPSLRPDSLRLVSETTVLTLRIRNHTDAEAPLRAVRLSFPVEGGVTLANPAEIERTVPPIPPLDSVTLSWT
ncbi:MAG: hypothetical protein JXA28_05195, partial [Bacteroidetes bacterium]|nr:hypothetical protein [Bacteroidota bacterium]